MAGRGHGELQRAHPKLLGDVVAGSERPVRIDLDLNSAVAALLDPALEFLRVRVLDRAGGLLDRKAPDQRTAITAGRRVAAAGNGERADETQDE